MGIAAQWISVKGLSKEDVLERLALQEMDERFSLETEWSTFRLVDAFVAVLKSDRVLVGSYNSSITDPALAEKVSVGAELVTGSMEEHVMYSEACGYVDGRRVWRITCESESQSDDEPNGVEVEGDLPHEFDVAVRRKASGFELPIEVCGLIGGYRPDEDLPGFDNIVTIAVHDAKARKAARAAARQESGGFVGALKRLFGG